MKVIKSNLNFNDVSEKTLETLKKLNGVKVSNEGEITVYCKENIINTVRNILQKQYNDYLFCEWSIEHYLKLHRGEYMNPIKNNNMDFGEAYISKEMCIDLILSKYDNEDNLEIEKTILNYDGENVAELIESMINEKVLYYIEMLMNNINSIKNNIIENKKIYWE